MEEINVPAAEPASPADTSSASQGSAPSPQGEGSGDTDASAPQTIAPSPLPARMPEPQARNREANYAENPAENAPPAQPTAEAEALRGLYPDFDYAAEAADPAFAALVQAGVPLRQAYETMHLDDLLVGAMQYSARRTMERLAGAALAGQQRPMENGLAAGSPVRHEFDPRTMTGEQFRDLRERVYRGEKIYL